ncbi:MAG: TetR/AcrR family transcriptional regulator [Bacteroidetes bacterium]|nr:TetR/AcrR family transcriptional regulator [Bacteroidota bacterium]HET6245336.1 TetR/AcrR family transcriptional regulator [Bacteroidia bacterium]
MPFAIQIKLNEKLYLRNPEDSELGRKIIGKSIHLIEEIGFEEFTFKKAAKEINSTEASIYRYFENKHKLLVYLISWYYAWIDYLIDYQTNNIVFAEERLKIIIRIISESYKEDPAISHIDESLLHKIVVAESAKAYLTKLVDKENKAGFFSSYKILNKKIGSVIQEVNTNYPYPNSLASTIIETAHEQLFFGQHLPSLSDIKAEKNQSQNIADFLEHLVFSVLKSK